MAKSKKLKDRIELTIPLYGVRFMILSTRQAEAKFLGYDEMSNNHCAHVSVEKCSEGIEYVLMTFCTIDDYCAETLTHESVHAAWRVLQLVGVQSTVDNQEPLAYLAGWISKEVNRFMMDHVEAEKVKK